MLFLLASEGILGNEMVDEVVKEACSSGPRRFFLIPYSDLQAEARSKSQLRFHNYLKSKVRDTGAYYSTLYLSESVKPWYFKLPLNRSEVVLVNRLRSNHYNHYNLNYSLYRKNTIDSCGNPRQGSIISFLIVRSLWTNPDLYLLILGISPPKSLNIPHLDSADCSFPFLRLLIFFCCAGGCRGSFPLSLPFSDSLPSISGGGSCICFICFRLRKSHNIVVLFSFLFL